VQGHAVTLAGTDPISEVRLLRDYVKWPGHRTWFVDNDITNVLVQNALKKIKEEWPQANTELKDLRSIIPKLEAIGFANLDFMGWPLQSDNWECFTQVAKSLLPGAILGFTWLRGRENLKKHASARLLWRLGKGYEGDERRWVGFQRAAEKVDRTLKLIGRYQYFSNHSPMSIAVFRKDIK